jgi:phosphohistidine swiveling domain-containing protein
VSDITYPDKHTPLVESQISLLTIGAKLQKKKIKPGNIKNHVEIYQLLKNYLKKYSSIPVNFTENPWSEEDITNQLKDLMKEDCQKEKQKISIQHKERIKKSKLILKKINNQKVKNIADSLKAGVFLNEYRKCVFCRASLAYRPLMRAIAEKYGLTSWKECWKLTPQEISRLYFGGDKRILNVLPKRKLVGVMPARNKNNYRFLSDKELALFWSEIEKVIPTEEKAGELKKINGTIANPGIIRGTAKIILGSHDFHKFKEGDIIVATMTSVDFVPLMKRASAFVTNEGGITCHASIVSRELNKPCIIGTKIATKVLKDGDLVEVDANKGIVRIIRD